MNDLQVIEVKGKRVLTTKQIAEAYETTEEKVRWNFKYNKKKYEEGKHYILIQGNELRELKTECEFQTLFKQAKSVCLWTEKGALLHAKSLNTDKAWEVYEYLVDFYFRVKEQSSMQTPASETGKLVVDAPENVRLIEAVRRVEDDLTCMKVLLDQCTKFVTKEEYEKRRQQAEEIVRVISRDMILFSAIVPNEVRKNC